MGYDVVSLVRAFGDALLDRMQEVELPWVFDEAARPPLVG